MQLRASTGSVLADTVTHFAARGVVDVSYSALSDTLGSYWQTLVINTVNTQRLMLLA